MTGSVRLVRVALALAALLAVTACKQGEGDRCQNDSDCDPGLVCNESLEICQGVIQGDANAIPDYDASVDADPNAPDAAPPDALEDAPVDATFDANVDAT
jgi:hypothetical protein